jgi:hypothetical protein
MANTTAAPAGTGSAASPRGFGYLPCPRCGEEASIRIDLDDLDTFTCQECDNDFTLDTVRNLIDRWQRVLAWIDRAPGQ